MHSPRAESELRCEQCGGPLTSRLGCLRCLLTVGVEPDAEAATANSGNRSYQHYEVLTRDDGSLWELGRGAMGVTFKAVDINLRIPVALKVLNGHISAQPEAQQRFLREARAAAQLRHPNVASVFHFGVINALPPAADDQGETESGDCFYAMEFVEGETLEKRLRRCGRLDPATALTIGVQIARALAAAEKRGLVHRDLKPANVMLLDEEESGLGERSNGKVHGPWVKVIDFGLAKATTAEDDVPGSTLSNPGTPAFSSPEQQQGLPLDIRSDIYSLGATLWYALTGRFPVSERKAHAVKAGPTVSIGQWFTRDIPLPVIRLLESMMAADPDQRPLSAVALGEALQECLEQITGQRSLPTPHKRRGRTAIFAIAAVAAVFVGLAFYLWRPFSPADDKSIAVLPFQNLSTDPNNAFFSVGLQDDLVSSLVKIRDLKVVARTGMSTAGGGDIASIGRALGVRHVLRGSLRRTGDRVLLQVSLLDTRDGRTIWSERYDRTLANAVSLQGELAASIADALDATLSPREKVDLHSKPTVNPDAYVLYLRARKFESGAAIALSNYEAAEALYEQALAFDPGFALAHARLASRLALLYHFRGPSEDLKTRAHLEVRTALQLQPNLGEGHLAKGLCSYYIDHDFERALPEFGIARRLLPNDPEAGSFIAYIHRRQGKWRQARRELEQVAAQDPHTMGYQEELFATASLVRDWRGARMHIKSAEMIAPDLIQVKVEHAYLDIWERGNTERLRKAYAEFTSSGGPDGDIAWCRWDAALLDRDFARAQAALDGFPYQALASAFMAPLPKAYLEGCIRLAQGDSVHAQESFEIARPSMEAETLAHPRNALRHARLGLLYAYMGRKAAAIREGERAVQLEPVSGDRHDGGERLCTLALIHARVGDNDQAIAMIRSLLTQPGCVSVGEASMSMWDLRLRWQWDLLRKDPRFQKILAGPEPATIY